MPKGCTGQGLTYRKLDSNVIGMEPWGSRPLNSSRSHCRVCLWKMGKQGFCLDISSNHSHVGQCQKKKKN